MMRGEKSITSILGKRLRREEHEEDLEELEREGDVKKWRRVHFDYPSDYESIKRKKKEKGGER